MPAPRTSCSREARAARSPACRSRTRTSSARTASAPRARRRCWRISSRRTTPPSSSAGAAAGTVLLGKTNMDEFAMGSSNETSYFGPVKNPWDHTRVPGGSSGGSAAAVAARLAPAATGTDTGGSIRQPAALTNLTGIKPTYGRVSRYGMIAFASSLDQAGVLARSAEDAALLLEAMAGFDPRDSTSVDRAGAELRGRTGPAAARGCASASSASSSAQGLDPAVEKCVRAAIELLQQEGAVVKDVSLPSLPLSVPTYYVVAPAECSSNLSRFDGVRFGHRCESAERPARPLQALARRRLRRRGEAPHHDRHVRAVGRLLRRVLPQGAEVPRADRRRFRARLRARSTWC